MPETLVNYRKNEAKKEDVNVKLLVKKKEKQLVSFGENNQKMQPNLLTMPTSTPAQEYYFEDEIEEAFTMSEINEDSQRTYNGCLEIF